MKKLIIVICAILTAGCAGSSPSTIEPSGKFSFSEIFVSHDTKTGDTEVIFYNIPRDTKFTNQAKSTSFMKEYCWLNSFTIVSEETFEKQNVLNLRAVLKAKNQLIHTENLTELFSKILKLEVEVSDIEINFPSEYIIGVIISSVTNNMYFPSGNTTKILMNEKEKKVMYLFNIADAPVEFLFGYK